MNKSHIFITALVVTLSPFAHSQGFRVEKNGKRVSVTKAEFFDHHISKATGKYVLVPVPDGWNCKGHLVEVATKKKLFIVNGAPGKTITHAISSDQKFLIVNTMDAMTSVTLWDIEKGKKLHSFSSLKSLPNKVVFSSDNKKVIAVGNEGDSIIWDTFTGKELKKIASTEAMLKELVNSL